MPMHNLPRSLAIGFELNTEGFACTMVVTFFYSIPSSEYGPSLKEIRALYGVLLPFSDFGISVQNGISESGIITEYLPLKFPLHLSEDEDDEEAAHEGNTEIAEFLCSCK